MRKIRSSRRDTLLVTTLLLAGGVLAASPAIAARSPSPSPLSRRVLPAAWPSWADPAADTGAIAGTTVLDVRVYLAGRDPAGLSAYARMVSSPGSPLYRHYLTPAQFARRFGPTGAQVRAVTGWLAGAGLTVTGVTQHYVAARGDAAAIRAAFGTPLDSYRTPSGTQRAPRSPVTVPVSVTPAVLTVTGLSTTSARPAADLTSGPVNLGACSAYWGQKTAATLPPAHGHVLRYTPCGYLPAQLRAAYQVVASGLTGKGVTIAIVDTGASPSIAADVSRYARRHGDRTLRPGQLTQYLPADIRHSCAALNDEPDGYGEESLDVEAAHAMAPDAAIAYVGADCATGTAGVTDMLDAETRIVDGHLASIVSDSWHLGSEAQLTPGIAGAYEQVFEEGAAEGIGFYFSSGDRGDLSAPGHKPAVQYPASDPWVTAVGGTSLALGAGNRYLWETGWGTMVAPLAADGKSWTGLPGTFQGGAGGGPSALFAQPFYQTGIPPSLSHAGTARVVPDIAAAADPDTGMLTGLTTPLSPGGQPRYAEEVSGGTSLSTPLIAGIQADAQQAAGGIAIGFANPASYARYGTWDFRDVTGHQAATIAAAQASRDPATGAVSYAAIGFGEDTSLRAAAGYDDVTGVGTPTGHYLDSFRVASAR